MFFEFINLNLRHFKNLALRFAIYFIIFVSSFSVFAQPSQVVSQLNTKVETPQNFQAEWKMSLLGITTDSDFKSSQLMRLKAELQANYWLDSNLFFDLHPVGKFESGSTQSIDNKVKPENSITFQQAALQILPTMNTLISVGALDQSVIHSPTLVGEQAFPELRAQANVFSNRIWKAGPVVGYAIPTSSQLSPETGDKEATPSLTTTGIFANLEVNKSFFWKTRVNYFQYSKLPQNIMNQSVLDGNTASDNKVSETNYNLKYQYKGIEALSSTQFPIYKSFDGILKGNFIQNSAAPTGLNTGYSLGGGGATRLSKELFLEVTGSYFRIEPDSSVAFYSSDASYNTNRIGYSSSVVFDFKKRGFKIETKYTEAGLIYESSTQSQEKQILIKLETSNASL